MSTTINAMLTAGAIGSLATGPSPHVARYFARLDARLATLTANGHGPFLRAELAKWQYRYATFRRKVEHGLPTDSGVTAWDYMEMLGGLDRRLGKLAEVAA